MKFIPSDQPKVSKAWRSIGRRTSAVTGSPRGASTPAHAIWNFAYSIGAAEVEIALRSVGLDPGVSATGLHADTNNRSAATWDVLERSAATSNRVQQPDGRVRLTAVLGRELAEAVMPVSRQAVAPVAESLARTLAARVTGPPSHVPSLPTNLSGDARSRGRDSTRRGERKVPAASRRATRTLIPPACRRCGVELDKASNADYCPGCFRERRHEQTQMLKAVGPVALARFRESGDPARRAATRAKIGTKIAIRNRERAAWDRDHDRPDPEVFRTEILPTLAEMPTSRIAAATGLSRNFVATIKSGKHVPHPLHWTKLRDLAAI